MQLSPRYGSDPAISLDGTPGDVLAPTVRQRRRLAATLAALDDAQWAHPSRCEAWSCRDVIVHLDSTNGFWAFAIEAGRRGEPTTFLTTFDPVSSPAQLVDGSRGLSNADVLDRFVASTEALLAVLESLAPDEWSALAEAPPGHVSIDAVAHHALWDSWVHERDILLPLGLPAEQQADEIAACLRYGAALGPALAWSRRATHRGTMAIDVTDPGVQFVVDIGEHVQVRSGNADADLVITGDAVQVLEAFSVRVPLTQTIPAETAWMLTGLTEQFDQAPA